MASHNQLGQTGEKLAQQYLIRQGHTILATNWRSGHNEIDIISTHNNTLIFTEVKTRSTEIFGSPEQAVTETKIRHLAAAATDYINQTNSPSLDIRFDIITIIKNKHTCRIEQIEDAFPPPFYTI